MLLSQAEMRRAWQAGHFGQRGRRAAFPLLGRSARVPARLRLLCWARLVSEVGQACARLPLTL